MPNYVKKTFRVISFSMEQGFIKGKYDTKITQFEKVLILQKKASINYTQ